MIWLPRKTNETIQFQGKKSREDLTWPILKANKPTNRELKFLQKI